MPADVKELVAELRAAAAPHPGTTMNRAADLLEQQARDLDAVRAEVTRVRGLIDLDRTGLASALNGVRRRLEGWSWLGEDGSWGCYSYEDHTVATMRREFGNLFDETTKLIDRALNESGNRADSAFCPSEPDREAEMDALRAEVAELRGKLEAAERERDEEHGDWSEARDEADAYSSAIVDACGILGCERDWSNLHDKVSCLADVASAVAQQRDEAHEELATLRQRALPAEAVEALADVRAWVAGGGRYRPLGWHGLPRCVMALVEALAPAPAAEEPRKPAPPMRGIVFAEPVAGGYLVTLECGHKLATRLRRVSYACATCAVRGGERCGECGGSGLLSHDKVGKMPCGTCGGRGEVAKPAGEEPQKPAGEVGRCCCADGGPGSYEGPMRACPVHGEEERLDDTDGCAGIDDEEA